jgi:hypothetical protein
MPALLVEHRGGASAKIRAGELPVVVLTGDFVTDYADAFAPSVQPA